MRRGMSFVAALCAIRGAEPAAWAGPPPPRVVVAGPANDTIAARVQKELTALGFEAIRAGDLDSCTRSAIVAAAQDAFAIAATCSDGDQVGVWVIESGTLRLRDVVVVRDEGDSGRETTAVRAAEVTRATIAMHEVAMHEEEEARSKAAPAPAPSPSPPPRRSAAVVEDNVDRPAPKPTAPALRGVGRAPMFLVGAGFSSLLGVDASVAAFSGQAEVGILRHLTATARIEYPVESSDVNGVTGDKIDIAPAFAGAGIGIPLTAPHSRVIPRLGAGAGVAWLTATKRPTEQFISLSPSESTFVTVPGGEDSTASFAAYASAGVSMRLYKPLRLTADGIFGSTTSRLVVREVFGDQRVHVAYWGTPFGAVALRLELQF